SEGNNSRGECSCHESRPCRAESRARQVTRRPESKTPREDQPARLADTSTVAKRKRTTRSSTAQGAGKGRGTQSKGGGGKGQGVLARKTPSSRKGKCRALSFSRNKFSNGLA